MERPYTDQQVPTTDLTESRRKPPENLDHGESPFDL